MNWKMEATHLTGTQFLISAKIILSSKFWKNEFWTPEPGPAPPPNPQTLSISQKE